MSTLQGDENCALTACVLVIDTLVVPGTPLRVVVERQEAYETVV